MSLPEHVEEAMADLAVTFHWTPADCAGFSLAELMQWRDRARRRTQRDAD